MTNIILLIITLILFFTPLLGYGMFPSQILKFSFFQTGILIIVCILLLLSIFNVKYYFYNQKNNPLNLPLLLFFISALISYIPAYNKGLAINQIRDFFCLILFFYIISFYSKDISIAKKLLHWIIYSAVIVSIIGIIQFFDISPTLKEQVTSTMGHANYLGEFLAMVLLAGIGLWKEKESITKWVFGFLLIIIFICFVMTNARSAWLGFIIGLGIWGIGWLKDRGGLKIKLRYIGIIGLILFVFLLITIQFKKEFILARLNTESIIQRIYIWQDTLNIIKDYPLFGVGVSNFEIIYPKYRTLPENVMPSEMRVTYVHNDYLQVFAEQGVIGIIGFLWLIITTLVYIPKYARIRPDMIKVIIPAIVAFYINSIFTFGFYNPVSSLIFWTFCGMMAGRKEESDG